MECAVKSSSIATNISDLVKKAVFLSWFTIIYNLIEGIVSIKFGLSDDSISLAGFGIDSLIEVASAVLVLWRLQSLSHGNEKSFTREKSATKGIGILFLVLAVFTLISSAYQLLKGGHPETTKWGIIISILSLSFMYFLWRSKETVGKKMNSKTVLKDADCSLACIKLSVVLLIGSLLFMFMPSLWWADSTAGIALSILIGKEGWETYSASLKTDFNGGCGCN